MNYEIALAKSRKSPKFGGNFLNFWKKIISGTSQYTHLKFGNV